MAKIYAMTRLERKQLRGRRQRLWKTIFQYGKLKFIPIDAVAAVVECKSNSVSAFSVDKAQQVKSEDGDRYSD